ncbi:spermatogenesis-associated protein 2-like protein [Hippopotamus amphibius kiboko]|uniref:spermatogenesis-associated protein 2-like protein n=1 Tax=Hippopotamus amphibius kiboko TaxID=575201 RepID=UPI0025973093|nr:spermatogenesis-associated protein 2-like protein [Hippopotamus amphibius kiboko]
MSRPQPPSPDEDTLETLLDDLIGYYLDRAGEGRLEVCRQAALTCRARWLLDTGVPLQLYLPEDVAPHLGPTHSQGAPSSAQHVYHKLARALEFLELISVNLLLFPWRKEIRSLKTYTGNFAYWVRPVLSEHTLHTILGRLGYMATSEAEFSLIQAISKEDTKQMVFEIFLTRNACEAVLGTSGRQLLALGRETVARPHCRPSSERGLLKTHKGTQEAQSSPGPSAGSGTERTLAESPDGQHSLPVALSLPEISIAPHRPLPGPLASLGPPRHPSTRSDSEEFLTCYSDLVLHRTPLFPRDHPLSSLKGKQLQGPGLGPSPPPGETAAPSGSSTEQPPVLNAAPESKEVTIPRQLCLTPGSRLSENSLAPKPEALPELATPGTDAAPPSTPSDMDELCEYLVHLLRPPTPASHPGGSPGSGVEENGQSEPLMRPEPAREGGSPESRVAQFWRSPQAPSHVQEPPSTHYIPPEGLEVPVPTQGYYTSNS